MKIELLPIKWGQLLEATFAITERPGCGHAGLVRLVSRPGDPAFDDHLMIFEPS